ncbi:MAG: hypothetical protein U0172_03615 [Nitrospiraceae bacterium]
MPFVSAHWRNPRGAASPEAERQPTLFDVPVDPCAGRHGGDRESGAAFQRGDRARQREAVFVACCVLHARSGQGVTLDEVSASLQVAPNRISGRISELVHDGVLVPTGARRRTRAGCAAKVYAPAHERGRG